MSAIEEVQQAEASRIRALTEVDSGRLGDLLSNDFVHVHSSGRAEDKASYIKAFESGKSHWTTFGHSNISTRDYGTTVLMYGRLTASKEQSGIVRHLLFQFSALWNREDGMWKLAFWHNTKPAPDQVH